MEENDYRTKGLEEKGRQCQACGTDEDIVVHHIDGDRSNDSLDNLIPLCQDCHAAVHAEDDDYQELADQLPDAKFPPGGSIGENETERVERAMLSHPDPVVTAGEIADILDCSSRHALDLLRLLEHSGEVKSKKAGARAVAWWHTDRTRPSQKSEEPENERDERRTRAFEPEEEEIETDDAIAQAVENAAANWDDSAERIDARKAAARAVLSALREQPMSKSEIIDDIFPEFSVEGQSARTWWRKNLAEGPGAPIKAVAEYNRGSQKWEWK